MTLLDPRKRAEFIQKRNEGINFADLKAVAKNAASFHAYLGGPIPEDASTFVSRLMREHPHLFDQVSRHGDLYFHEAMINYQMALRWVDYGMSVFDITTGLLASLLLTDCDNVEPDEVRFPFPTFAIRLPANFWHIYDDLTETDTDVAVLWVHQLRALDKADLPNGLNFVSPHMVLDRDLTQYVQDRLLIRAVGRSGISVWEVRDVPWKVPTTVEWVNTHHGIVDELTQHEVAETELHMQKAIRRLLVNLSLYLSEKGLGTKVTGQRTTKAKRRKKAKSKRQQKDEPRPNVWLLGQEVKVHSELIQAARDWSEQDKQKQGARWRVKKRFIVQGHWRNQAHGPGRTLRKRIRIEPFWKGPREGAKLSHLYTLGDKGKDE